MVRSASGGPPARRSERAGGLAAEGGGWRLLAAAALLSFLPLAASCAGGRIGFPYPAERGVYPEPTAEMPLPRVFLAGVVDVRPPEQRRGQGHFAGITFPADHALQRPADVIYREALAQDLAQTRLAELVPLPRQADYQLAADLHSLHCRLERSPASFLMPPLAGMMVGAVFGKNASDRVKTGVVAGILLTMAVPMPTQIRAEAEVRLTLRDAADRVVWRQTCLGEIDERIFLSVTAREDKKLAERYLPRAVKRANACLLGQLRQFLVESAAAGAEEPAADGQ